MSLANWRIGYRLGAGFAILILMLFVVSIFPCLSYPVFRIVPEVL